MSDVYNIQTVMTLGGNLAPELAKILKNMQAVDKGAKSIEKSLGRWASPIDRAVTSMGRLSREMGNVQRGAARVEREHTKISRSLQGLRAPASGMDREMMKWATAMGRPLASMGSMRSATQGVAASARGVSQSIGGWASRINAATAAMRRMNSASAGVHFPQPAGGGNAGGGGGNGNRRGVRTNRGGHGRHGPLAHEGSALAGIVGVAGGVHMAEEVVKTGVDMRHIELGMRQTGASQEQVDHAKKVAYEGSQQFPNLSPVEIFEHINDLRGILGTMDKAIHEAPDLMPEFSALKAKAGNHGAKQATSEIYSAVKSAETANEITADGVKKHVNSLTRLAFWYGDKLNPSNYFTAQKNAGQMMNLTSDRFKYGPFAALSQEIGPRAGTQFATFAAKGVAGLRMMVSGLDEAAKYDLLEPSTIQRSKNGRVKPGAQFRDANMASSDPDLWLYNKVLPKLKAGGVDVDNKAELLRSFGKIFTDKNAYGFLFELAQQRGKLEKDTAGFEGTSGDTTAYRRDDPYAALQGAQAQTKAVGTALAEPAIPGLVQSLNQLNAFLGGIAGSLERNPTGAQSAFGVGASVVGGAATAGVAALTIAGVGMLTLPALVVGSIAALTIGTLTIPWDKLWSSMGFQPGIANGQKNDHGVKSNPSDMLHGVDPLGASVNDLETSRRRAAGTQGLGLSTENVAASVDQAAAALGRTGTVATQATPGLEGTATGLTSVSSAASGVPGALEGAASALSGFVSRILGSLNSMGVAGPPGAGGASPAAPGPGKTSAVMKGGAVAPVHVATTVNLDGRKVAQNVTRHQVAANDTRNGTGSFDSNRLKTPVGYSAPTQA